MSVEKIMPVKSNSIPMAPALQIRKRRLRQNAAFRSLVRETQLSVNDFLLPVFVEENVTERAPISSLPGIYREAENTLEMRVKEISKSGCKAIMLFGVSHHKDAEGRDSLHKDGLFARMIERAKQAACQTGCA